MSAKYATVLTENAGSNLRILANNVSIQTWKGGAIAEGASLTQVLHSASNVTAMTIANGNVGIGTTIPRAPLDIQGNIRFTGDLLRNGQPFTTAWVTSGNTVYIGAGSNLAVGTNNTQGQQLYVEGDGQITGSLTVADLTVLNQSFINGDNAAVRSMIQIHPVRRFFRVTNSNQNTFTLPMDGVAEADDIDAEVFLNGVKLAYQNSNVRDFVVDYAYPTASNTIFTVSLTQPALYDDVLDITVWPKFPSTEATMQPGYVYQQFSSLWNVDSGNVYFNTGYVGIGTDNPTHNLEVVGSVRMNSTSTEVFTKSLSVDTNNSTNICTVQSTYGAFVISMDVIHSELGSSMSKSFTIACRNNMTNGNWFRVNPVNSSGRDGTQDFAVDISVASTTATLRLVRTSGVSAVADNFKCIVRVSESENDPVIITESNTTAMTVSVSGVLDSTPLGMNLGNVGVGTTNPRAKMHVWQTGTGDAMRIDDALNDTTPFIITDGGNVGVGTATPLAKMHVVNTDNSDVFRVDDVAADTTPMIVDRTGNVGYGTSPAVAMHMEKDVGGANMELRMKNKSASVTSGSRVVVGWESTANQMFFNMTMGVARGSASILNPAGSGHVAELTTVQAMPMLFGTNSTEKMRIQADGNVGIGVAAPTEKLEVSGNIRASGNIFSGGTLTASNLNIIGDTVTLNTTTSNTEQLVVNNAGTGPALTVIQSGTNTVANFIDSETGSALFIANGGSVGIGTMDPLAKLHVEGQMLLTSTLTTRTGMQIGQGASGNIAVEIGSQRTADGASFIDFTGDTFYTDYGLRIVRWSGSNGGTEIQNRGTGQMALKNTEAAPITLWTTNTERIRVLADGKVGIGTNNPAQLLHVAQDTAGVTTMQVVNQSASTAALATVSARINLSTSETRIGTLGASYTTSGAFIASGGFLEAGAGLSGGLSILSTHASGAIRFYTAGSAAANERMEIDANGKVMIASSGTGGFLNVGSGNAQFPINVVLDPTTHATSKRAAILLGDWGVLQDSMGDGVKNFAIYQGGGPNTTRFYISTTGNVGINTGFARGLLTIGGDVLGNTDASGNPWIQGVSMKVNSAAVADRRNYSVGQSDNNNVYLGWTYNATASLGYGALQTYGGSNALAIQVDGRVGVGTTNPANKVDVYVNDASTVQQLIANANTSTGRAGISLKAGTNSGFNLQQTADTGLGVVENYGAGGIGYYAKTGSGTHTFWVGDGNTRAMTIANSGNIGIGTNTTAVARLTLNPAVAESKICLWGDATNHYGFGVSGAQLNYHVFGSTDRHVFYYGGTNGNGTELVRFAATGAVFSTGITFSGSLTASATDATARQSAGLYVKTDRSHGLEYQSEFSRWNTALLTADGFTFKKVSTTYSSSDAGTNMVVIDGSGNVGIGTTGNLTAGLHINTNHMNGMLVETDLKTLPPAAMTADTTTLSSQTFGNGTYVASASTTAFTDNPWKVFDGSDLTYWHSAQIYTAATGVYAGTVSTTAGGTPYSGEWIQLQLPVSIRLTSFILKGRQDASLFLYRSPRTFYLLGSQDGNTWNLLFSQVDKTDWTAAAVTFTTTTTEAYKYFRLVITRVGNFSSGQTLQDYAQLCEFDLVGQIVTMTAKDGDIGIGLLNPTAPLHVQGDSLLIGRVGVGTTTPTTALDVRGGDVRIDGTNTLSFGTYGGGFYMTDTTWIRTGGSKSFYQNTGTFRTDGTLHVGNNGGTLNVANGGNFSYRTNVLFANTSGNVGVGTATPFAPLHVVGNAVYSSTSASIGIGTTTIPVTAGYGGARVFLEGVTDPGALIFSRTATNVNRWIIIGNQLGSNLSFQYGTTTPYREPLTLVPSGNIGIGITNPTARLHVLLPTASTGDIVRVDDQYSDTTPFIIKDNGRVGIGIANPSSTLDVDTQVAITTQSAGGYCALEVGIGRTDNGFAYIDLIGDATYSDYGMRIIRNNAGANTSSQILHRGTGSLDMATLDAAPISLRTSGTDRLYITSAGNVGIGTTVPATTFHSYNGSGNTYSTIDTLGIGIAGQNFAASGVAKWVIANRGADSDKLYISSSPGTLNPDGPALASSMKVLITQDGNVGIGVANPTNKLQVLGNSYIQGQLFVNYDGQNSSAGTANINIQNSAGDRVLALGATNTSIGGFTYLQGQGGGDVRVMAINPSGGNVAIGTTNPSARFHIVHPTAATGNIVRVDDETSDTTPFIINQDGNVGIQKASPTTALDVAGTVTATAFAGDGASITNVSQLLSRRIFRQLTFGGYGSSTTNRRYALVSTVSSNNGVGRIVGWVGGHANSVADQAKLTFDILVDTRGADVPIVKGNVSTDGAPSMHGVAIYRNATSGIMMIYLTGGAFLRYYIDVYNIEIAAIESSINWSADSAFTPQSGFTLFWDSVSHVPANTTAYNVYCTTASTPVQSMTITNAGSVGIGTTNPTQLLNIFQDSSTSGIQLLLHNGNVASGRAGIQLRNGTSTYNIQQATTNQAFEQGQNGDVGFYNLGNLSVYDKNNTNALRFRVQANGNVGIGQASPAYKLDVAGQCRITQSASETLLYVLASGITANQWVNLTLGKATSTNNTANFRYRHAGGDGITSNYVGIGFWNNDDLLNVAATGNVGIGTTTPLARFHVLQPTASTGDIVRIDDETGGSTPFIIKDDGNVGIGTITPLAKLHVVTFDTVEREFPPIGFTNSTTIPTSGGTPSYSTTTLTITGSLYGNGTYTAIDSGVDSYQNTTYGGWASLDGNTSTMFRSFATYNATTFVGSAYVILNLPTSVKVSRYTLYQPANLLNSPLDWQLQASLDGTTWVNIDTRTNISWTVNETKTFTTTTSTGYSRYRLLVTKTNGATTLYLFDWKLYGYIKNEITDSTTSGVSYTTSLIASGNVGIGTTNPLYKLHVAGDSYMKGRVRINENATTNINDNIIIGYVSGDGAGDFHIYDQSSARTVIGYFKTLNYVSFHNANVGIGTTTAVSKLTVNPIVSDRNAFDHSGAPVTITQPTATSTTLLNDQLPVLHLCRQGTSSQAFGARATFALSRYENTGTSSRTRMDVQLAHDTYDTATVMSVRSDGRVGIGTTNPRSALHLYSQSGSTANRIIIEGAAEASQANTNMACALVFQESSGATAYDQFAIGTRFFGSGALNGMHITAQANSVSEPSFPSQSLMSILQNGNVGIGTTTPLARFHVLQPTASTGDIVRVDDETGDTTPFIIKDDGKVGIGKANPATILDVNGTITATTFSGSLATTNLSGTITNAQLAGSITNDKIVSIAGNKITGTIIAEKSATTEGGEIQLPAATNVSTGSYIIDVFNSNMRIFNGVGGTLNNNLTLSPAGFVGIGGNTPSFKLDVEGKCRITQSASDTLLFVLASGITAGQYCNFTLGKATSTNNTANFIYRHAGDGATSNYVGIGFWNNDDLFNVAATGNVGVGTTNPTRRLHVENDAFIKNGLYVNNSGNNTPALSIADNGNFDNSNSYGTVNITRAADSTVRAHLAFIKAGNYVWQMSYVYGTNTFGLFNWNFSGSTTATPVMAWKTDGNVGIGISSPTYKLDVNGESITRGWMRTTGNVGWYNDTHGGGITMEDPSWVRVFNNKGFVVPNNRLLSECTVNGNPSAYITSVNYSTGTSAYAFLNVECGTGSSLVIFKNSSGRTTDGGVNTATVRNDAGSLRLQSSNAKGITISSGDATFDERAVWTTYGFNSIGNGNADNATMTNYNFRIRSWWGIGFPSFDDVNRILLNTRTGEISCTGDITAFASASDIRLKDNVTDLVNAIDILTSLRPVSFTWKHDMFNKIKRGTQDAGFIAQEVEPLLPHLMKTIMSPSDEGCEYKGIAYEKLTPYLVKGVQELHQDLQTTKEELISTKEELISTKNDVRALSQQVEDLKALVAQLLQK